MHPKVFFFLIWITVSVSLISCSDSGKKIQASKRPVVSLKIERYGKSLFEADTLQFKAALERLQKKFPFFLSGDLNDPKNIKQLYDFIKDSRIRDVYQKTIHSFPHLIDLEHSLSQLFSYIKYYFPEYKIPSVYSYVSDIYFEQPVMKKDSVLVIALDDYLGQNYLPYRQLDIPLYHRRIMKKEYIPIDVAKVIYKSDIQKVQHTTTLLDNMIEAGKMLYFMDAVLPDFSDTLKIGYTKNQWDWMEKHKKDVWSVMIHDNLLFSSNYRVIKKMMQPGPFTDGFSRTAPPSMGAWFGWQIVRKYMSEHHNTTLKQLFQNNDAQSLLHHSGYKP